ncbi:FolM Alternative dihydrofolate reductase 1 [Pseudoalteromonas luteoviolacea B = ATCC 29581]|nr:FolM Alternative dihydrofolate reductase 1 [Pseudoalteromonas luteoviolacea B = ATCC 29581]
MISSPILITGGAQRIGLALTEHFLAKQIPVILTYRTRHDVIDRLEAQGAICIQANIQSVSDIDELCKIVKQQCSSLRAIIHNASSWNSESLSDDYAGLFDDMMLIHAKLPYLLNLNLMDYLEAYDGVSDIVHITDYVVEKGSPKHIAYAASKAALDNLTRSFAAKCAPKIKVNAIAPSLIIFNEHDDEQYKAKTLQKSLMGIEPGCIEVINSIELVLSSRYITGRSIPVDGGRHLK